MKRIVLVAIGAKFIHSSLALKYLSRFEDNDKKHHLILHDFTINQPVDFILAELFREQPDIICFSCYIWNIEMVKKLTPELKKILPQVLIALGGPEVSYNSEAYLKENPSVDIIMRGEGELTFTELLDYWDSPTKPCDLADIAGLSFRQGDTIMTTAARKPLDLARLPFPYEDDSLEEMDKIIYYESSRGCPYNCAYCLSSVEKGVRFVPLEKVYKHLQRFLDAKVRQVKFVDRTFNCNKAHTLAIWRYLAEHDNGVTNFHFELTADLLDEELLDFLRPLRKGLFQFEIGVQSTNPKTIQAIRRTVSFEKVAQVVRRVHEGGNIHQHLDLIAGLPYEDYASFRQSFNDVYALRPEQLQLGFLKVLSGTYLANMAQEWGIIRRDYAPYEVLSTRELPPQDVLKLKSIEEMVETYYNSGKFQHTLRQLVGYATDAFAFYEGLAAYWQDKKLHYQSHSKIGLCDILYGYGQSLPGFDAIRFQWLMKLDLCLHEKPRKLPVWLTVEETSRYREKVIAFYQKEAECPHFLPAYQDLDSKALERASHIEIFPNKQVLLFDYSHKDILGNARYLDVTTFFWSATK